MANFSIQNILDSTKKFSNITTESETKLNFAVDATVLNIILTIIFNMVVCPFTVLLNMMVIIAVKRRPRLQSYANILLACLAVTDALTGLTTQPLYSLWKILQLLEMKTHETIGFLYTIVLRALSLCSSLHLVLVTSERLIAIRFTQRYASIVTRRNIRAAVIASWVVSTSYAALGEPRNTSKASLLNLLAALIVVSCVIFMAFAYVILFCETRRHVKMIKAHQLPQEEVHRFNKEKKALKTTVLVVSAVCVSFLPMAAATVTVFVLKKMNIFHQGLIADCLPCIWVRTFIMFNSVVNPLIYCWRQKEMRRFVFRLTSPAVGPE